MSTGSKRAKIENEIAKYRAEKNQEKLIELSENLKRKYGSTDDANMLIKYEMELDAYFTDYPISRENITEAQKKLKDLYESLEVLSKSQCKESLFDIRFEASMYMTKILYAQGKPVECLKKIEEMKIPKHDETTLCYLLKLLAEIFALKGLCIENNVSNQKDIVSSALKSYEKSIQASIKYLSQMEKMRSNFTRPQDISSSKYVSDEMKASFERGPLLYLQQKQIWKAIRQQRRILKCLDKSLTFSVQQETAKMLASILLRGVSDSTYKTILEINTEEEHNLISKAVSLPTSSNSKVSDNPTVPVTLTQEAILLLQIAETMINADPVLDMSAEHAESHNQTIKDSSSIYDLMTIAYSRFHLHSSLCASIERSLKYIFDDFHSWFQYGLSLHSSGKFLEAVQVFQDCCRINSTDPSPGYFAAKIYFEELRMYNDSIKFAKIALEIAESTNDDTAKDLLSDIYLLLGMAYTMKCIEEGGVFPNSQKQSMEYLKKAHEEDNYEPKSLLFLSLNYAHHHNSTLAMECIISAIEISPEDVKCLHLYILLLSSCKRISEAFKMLTYALNIYPDNVRLLITKCKLELSVHETETALCTWKSILDIWKATFEPKVEIAVLGTGSITDDTLDGRSMANLSLGNDLDMETSSVIQTSVAASKIEQAFSDCNSVISTTQIPANNIPAIINLKLRIWLLAVEIYLELGRSIEAAQFLQDAFSLAPLSPDVMLMKGKYMESVGDDTEAIVFYQHALSVNPNHTETMQSLAQIWLRSQKFGLAEKIIRDAVKINPYSATSWECLSEILQNIGDYSGAAECNTTCIKLESSVPILPYTQALLS